uniref:Mitochondrial inner membrane protease subunit n=1 Tax=Gallus gallus TaxID=9031 RepID=A0A8V0ZH52_CHICK
MFRNALGKTLRFLGYTVQYGCIAHCAFEYLGGIVVCSGPSMEPTIQSSDIVFSENLSRHFYSIRKGDIVIVKSPTDPKSNICKRVIGLEGDKVCTSNPSDFLKTHSFVPKGHVWLEGDNLRNSTDSRCYGPVPYGLIRGRICFKTELVLGASLLSCLSGEMLSCVSSVLEVCNSACWSGAVSEGSQ